MATPTPIVLPGSCNVVAAVAVATAAAAVVAVVLGGRTLLYFERRRNQAKLSVCPPLLLLLLRFLFPLFSVHFICHNSSSRQRRPKKGSSFSTRCTFHGEHRRRFHYISFHSFIPLPAARSRFLVAFIHFGLGDLIWLSTLSPCICRSLFAFGNKGNKAKRGEGHAQRDIQTNVGCPFVGLNVQLINI